MKTKIDLKQPEEKDWDHKRLGRELDLFTFSDTVGKGLPLWTPKGAAIRRTLERFIVDEEIKRGYSHVYTPDIAKLELYKKSGHYPYYKDSMYAPIIIDDEEFIEEVKFVSIKEPSNVKEEIFSQEQLEPAIIFLRILFPFIFFLSSSALLAAALQAVNHFFTIAFSPVLLNIIYIAALIGCLYYGFSIKFLCYGILFSGLLQFLMAIFFYFKYQFGFSMPDSDSRKQFKSILIKFMHCLLGVGVMELNLIIDGNIGSYLADGSITLLYYGTRFMQIPLGVIAISFSTVLLSHLSRVVLYAPRRLNIYLLEASKFVVWATLPASLFLIFTAEKLFSTAIMAKNVSVAKVTQASFILIIMASGLLFFAINKVLTSIFYSRGDTYSPAVSGGIATIINLVGNLVSLQFLGKNAIYGIAGSTVLFGIFQTVISFYQLHKKFKYHFYAANFFGFLVRYSLQIIIVSSIFVFLHNIFFSYLKLTDWYYFFYFNWGYWIIVVPLGLSTGYLLFLTRKLFNIELYFLGK